MVNFNILKRIRILELYDHFNKENCADNKGILIREVDMGNIEKLKNSVHEVKIPYSALFLKAAAMTLREFPQMNRILINRLFFKRLVELKTFSLSVAVERADASPDENYEAAFIYTVENTDQKSPSDIAKEIQGLSSLPLSSNDNRIRRWQLMLQATKRIPFLWPIKMAAWIHKNIPSSYLKNRGGAMMLSSPAKYGVDGVIAHWPYTLGFSFGLIKDRPSVSNGELCIRKTCLISLAFDRRIVSGSQAARFLNRLSERLEAANLE